MCCSGKDAERGGLGMKSGEEGVLGVVGVVRDVCEG
jgi:hypothetical protein